MRWLGLVCITLLRSTSDGTHEKYCDRMDCLIVAIGKLYQLSIIVQDHLVVYTHDGDYGLSSECTRAHHLVVFSGWGIDLNYAWSRQYKNAVWA